jgi:hypothetical protein
MEMILPNFEKSLNKGKYGEKLVAEFLLKKGVYVYKSTIEGSHPMDFLALKDGKLFPLDIKTKARRTHYKDTGINERNYIIYNCFAEQHSIDFWIIFVDEYEKRIYGNTLAELNKPFFKDGKNYPLIEKDKYNKMIRYWHIDKMLPFRNLTEEEVKKLKELSQRNYNYPNTVLIGEKNK